MWLRRSHRLATLTKLPYIKRRFKWTQVKQDAFEKIKRIVARDTFITYSDFNEIFKIHTHDSAFQLGVVISQKYKLISLYSRKITDAQQRYTITQK